MTAVVTALRQAGPAEVYLSPAQVCELLPGMTEKKLENLRGAGRGPQYFKPTQKTVLYREQDIQAWVQASLIETRGTAS